MPSEKYQTDNPNSHYLANINTLNGTNQAISLNRLPTLGEILANRTKTPVDLFTFYLFMRDVEYKVDYLDFWFDLVNHLNLCKHYVKGLRDSIVRHSYPDQRNSIPILEKSKHKSLSSSILLDLIINDHILEDNDSNRLSQFLRGDINIDNLDPKLQDLINQYNREEGGSESGVRTSNAYSEKEKPSNYANRSLHDLTPPTPLQPSFYEYGKNPNHQKRISSNSKLLDDVSFSDSIVEAQEINHRDTFGLKPRYVPLEQPQRISSINPLLLERLIKHSPGGSETNSFITRDNLKESTHSLLLKYFVEDSEKNLNLPPSLNQKIIRAIEVEGRDDPDIFNEVKAYVFNRIESEHLPRFLNYMAIRNVNTSFITRVILGFFMLLIGFWVGFIFIFLNYRKSLRPVVLVPFLIGFYCLVLLVYLIDPILVWFGLSESFSSKQSYFIRIRENFIRRLLVKRSAWVMFLVLLLTAIFTIIFSLVPGKRL